MYVGAQRPRLIADSGGLTIVNPLREHRVGWAAVTVIDATDLLRVRCEWPAEPGGERRQKSIHAWAVGASSRRQAFASMRGDRRPGEADKIVAALTARASKARPAAAPETPAARSGTPVADQEAPAATPEAPVAGPVSTWSWPALAIAGIPVLALLVVLAL
jgi:hypothetical protein